MNLVIRKLFSLVMSIVMLISSGVQWIDGLVNRSTPLIESSQSAMLSNAEDPIYWTAHRGVNGLAPENTIPAFELAVEKGYYSAECDIRLTTDGVWVLNHGNDLHTHYTGRGKIEEMTYAEVLKSKIRNGSDYSKYGVLRIPTLDEFLDVFEGTSTRPQIEIKTDGLEHLPSVLNAIRAHGMEKQAIIISFSLEQLKAIRALDKDVELWYLTGGIDDQIIADTLSIGGNAWISCGFDTTTVESMALAISKGVGVSTWTVDTIEDAERLYAAGVRYMETDRIAPAQ